jgi:outer membrane protein TolC
MRGWIMKRGTALYFAFSLALVFGLGSSAGAQEDNGRIVGADALENTITAAAPSTDINVSVQVPGGLTLDEAQQEAVTQSPEYGQAQAAERETSWGQFGAFSDGFLPQVTIQGQHFFAEQYSNLNVEFGSPTPIQFPGIYPQTTLTLDARFDLFDGFKNVYQLDSANNNHEAAKILSDWALLQLQEQVRLQFYQALAAQKLSEMADENVKTLQDHLRIVKDQLQNGQATRYDLLRVQVQLDESQSDQISAHDEVALAREQLTRTMGLKNDDRSLSGDLPVLDPDAILKNVSGNDFSQKPDLRAKELQALAAEDDSAASHAALWIPKVSLIGEYQWYNSPDYLLTGITNTSDFRTDYYVGASATWDILDGGASVAKANEADEKAKQAEEVLKAGQDQAPYDFDYWKRKLVSSVALYKAKLTDVDEAKESARLATVGFEAGTRTTTDVLDAELEEYRAAEGLVQAQIDSLEALVNLELSIGKRIENE